MKPIPLYMNKKLLFLSITILFGVFNGCNDAQYPEDIWEPDDQGNATPVITMISPSDSAFSGSDVITITGENFSENMDDILVYFNSELGELLSVSKTEIILSPPSLISDSVLIKVAIKGAFLFGEYDRYYKLYPRMIKYGNFDPYEESLWGLEVDNDENVYVGLFIHPEGDIERLRPPNAERDSSFLHSVLPTPSSMRIGPGNDMYYLDSFYPYIVKHNLSSGGPSFAAVPGNIADLDFDMNGNLYCGGSGNAIYTVQTDLTSVTSADYSDINISTIRVYDNYVYVAGTQSAGNADGSDFVGIWRNQIISPEGALGEKELRVDWQEVSNTSSKISCFTFDETGKIYISSNDETGILTIDIDSNSTLLYPKIISGPITKMTWGAGNYLYLNNKGSSNGIYRLELSVQGAPYYGRP
ncbi:MAG: IPT/TIG domain-containing protein [Candidatus Marinimicrobia bacterium]|jgi:hypothetical protein|nr:IPT/TIG domain-containing protein [Candidatus Neomarinimicrobiota bacterium]MBT3692327.1 IPT/TIG domain-containing protein [Candidatus Neomarinimicrobiota bacterium]MBT4145095.1 IPT/TIG domain-containing protein [Candidatus Neomarinimicrobiota bacterium]MBT4178053.1 IPT/TIG domain-containing protein [Candidatus Neomarinimicrobiota bacterium]MBT5355125.1 IPT/TIG domain-containing protein [Candidatus Neomarinimicrobiota bacterium]